MLPRRASLIGIFFAVLALAAQLLTATTLLQAVAEQPVRHGGALVYCDTPIDDDDAGTPASPHQHDPAQCGFCPLCLSSAAQTFALLPVVPLLPPPHSVSALLATALPPALAPPLGNRGSAQPRAPPPLT